MTLALTLLMIVGIIVYFVPMFIAGMRGVPNGGSIVVINLFLGWTFLGWVVALAMAMRDVPSDESDD